MGMQGRVKPFFFKDTSTLMGDVMSTRVSASKAASRGPGKVSGSCFNSNFLMFKALPPQLSHLRAWVEAKAAKRTKATSSFIFLFFFLSFLGQKKKSK